MGKAKRTKLMNKRTLVRQGAFARVLGLPASKALTGVVLDPGKGVTLAKGGLPGCKLLKSLGVVTLATLAYIEINRVTTVTMLS